MKLTDRFKEQSRTIQVLDIIFIICLIYEVILMMANMNLNMSISTLMLFIICVMGLSNLKK